MCKTSIAHLLIAIVLICPYLCLGGETGSESASRVTVGCTCCSDHPEQPGGETPRSPADQDTDCLCHGAIFDGSRTDDSELSRPTINWVLDVASTFTNLSLAAVSFEPPHQFPPFSTGRDVCALTCTLQL
ncbi:MAG TPA: hypothetical protein VMM76_05315 [Pirellulaceae bacterium]|nr:hypothetical protein [Pirellulaceae bacterium]